MKKVIALTVAVLIGIGTTSAQALLVEPEDNNTIDTKLLTEQVEENPSYVSYVEVMKDASFPTEKEMSAEAFELSNNPDQLAAGLLAIFLGDLGIHHFYTGQTLRGVLHILFCWTGVPAIIGLIEGIVWLCDSDEEWADRVANWNEE